MFAILTFATSIVDIFTVHIVTCHPDRQAYVNESALRACIYEKKVAAISNLDRTQRTRKF